ncbi:G-protein-signaling modulator 1, partial [Ophiophagus hannah]
MASPQTEELFDLIASSQSRRLDDQRASVGNLPGLRITPSNLGHLRMDGEAQEPGDEFFNMLMKCQRVQAKRMDEQRVDLASGEDNQAKD